MAEILRLIAARRIVHKIDNPHCSTTNPDEIKSTSWRELEETLRALGCPVTQRVVIAFGRSVLKNGLYVPAERPPTLSRSAKGAPAGAVFLARIADHFLIVRDGMIYDNFFQDGVKVSKYPDGRRQVTHHARVQLRLTRMECGLSLPDRS